MTNNLIAFFIAIGGAAWVYAKFMKSTGSNTQNSLIAAVVAGILLFFLALILLGFVPDPA